MIIKEYEIIKTENQFPALRLVQKHDFIYDDVFTYYRYNNYELEYLFFGDALNLQDNLYENFYVLSYNNFNEIIGVIKIALGGKKQAIIPFDKIFTYLLLSNSDSFICIHNHPNNNQKKSTEDIAIEQQIKYIADILDIEFKDSLIITNDYMDALHKEIKQFNLQYFEEE